MKHDKYAYYHNQFKDAYRLNSATYFDYLQRFKRIALSQFHWKNLPESMNERAIELSLYYTGGCAFLYDETKGGFINTKATTSGKINIYGIPTAINCNSYSYHTKRETYQGATPPKNTDNRNKKQAILVLNNYSSYPTAGMVELFAERLTLLQRSWDINIKQQKFPRLLLADKKTLFSIKKLVEDLDNNELNIITDKDSMLEDKIKSIDFNAPFVADKLSIEKKEIWNEFLTTMGISNIDFKKERVLQNEMDSKNEVINYNLQAMLIPRQKACEDFNRYFNPDKPLSVEVNADLDNLIKRQERENENE